jgi:predicted nucleotidyltransferase
MNSEYLFGFSENEANLIRSLIRERAGAYAPFTVWIFGSRSIGNYRKYSDVDLLFDGENLNSRVLVELSEALDDSELPYKFDLVLLKNLEPAYSESVLKSRKTFYTIS